jgi:general secretion pathway protein C
MTDWTTALLPRLAALGLDKRLPLLALLLVTALLAQTLAALTWDLIPAPATPPALPVASSAQPAARSDRSQQVAMARISQWHLFGVAQKALPKPTAKITEAPDTRLNLKLRGVVASSEPTAARAIIADGRGMQESYAIDDTLPGNAVLREIYPDRVILEYRGRLETLRLPKEDAPSALAPAVVKSTLGKSVAMAGYRRPPTQATTAENAALLRQYRDALTNNPQSLMNLVSVTPVNDEASHQLKGYRIHPGKDPKLLGRFGLKNGDVVTGVNGVPLNNPIKALEIVRDLTTASAVTLEVERNGVLESFVFQVE